MKRSLCILIAAMTAMSCHSLSNQPNDGPDDNGTGNETPAETINYADIYDQLGDRSQFRFPTMTRAPKKLWSVVGVGQNDPGTTGLTSGLQYHLLAQSLAGLVNRAVNQGRSDTGIWLEWNSESYLKCLQRLQDMGISVQGRQTAVELLTNNYGSVDGVLLDVKQLIDGYVLTDVVNNPESAIVASTAAHVFNSVIVDVRDEAHFKSLGLQMKYDATRKTTADAWAEFRDKCSNEALLLMPVKTGEIREFAICHGLFTINLNHRYSDASSGQNAELLKQVLSWLEPGSFVLGWEQGVGEDVFVNQISLHGHQMIASDWSYNHSLTGLGFREETSQPLAPVFNPKDIDFNDKRPCVSFMLSDGDNTQWLMNDYKSYLTNPDGPAVHMTYQMATSTMPMLAPAQLENLMNSIPQGCSVIEALGGGYYYSDNYGSLADRPGVLSRRADALGATMREHRVKTMAVICQDVCSAGAKQAYKEYAMANNQLEGIVAFQYSPYAAGAGEIMWVSNRDGIQIPVITVKYSIWNFGYYNTSREGSPAYIASKLNEDMERFSLVCVHSWSKFSDQGRSPGLTDENYGGTLNGASAARLCTQSLRPDAFNVVSLNELVWRVRMRYQPEQTQKILNSLL